LKIFSKIVDFVLVQNKKVLFYSDAAHEARTEKHHIT